MNARTLLGTVLIVGIALPLGASTSASGQPVPLASHFHYTLKTFQFNPDGEAAAVNDRGVVVGDTESDPSGTNQVALYNGRVHDLGRPPGPWVHAQAHDVNDAGTMAVSTDVFIAQAPVRKSAAADSLGAYVATWKAGRTSWYRLGGTTAKLPGAAAYRIAPDGDVAGLILSFDANGYRVKDRSTLWVRHSSPYTYSAEYPPLGLIDDVTSYGNQDVLVGRRHGRPAFLALGRSPVALTLTGTADDYGEADSVAIASPHMLYVAGIGYETANPTGVDVATGLLWTVRCTSSFSCHQAGNPTIIAIPPKCYTVDFPTVNSHRLVGGNCIHRGSRSYDYVPFLWKDGAVENLNKAVPAGSPHLDTFANLNARDQVIGSTTGYGAGAPPVFLASPAH